MQQQREQQQQQQQQQQEGVEQQQEQQQQQGPQSSASTGPAAGEAPFAAICQVDGLLRSFGQEPSAQEAAGSLPLPPLDMPPIQPMQQHTDADGHLAGAPPASGMH